MPFKDNATRREYNKKWALKNPDKAQLYKEKRATWRKTNSLAVNEQVRKWRKANPDKVKLYARKNHLKIKYNLTIEEYDKMLLVQNNKCGICQLDSHINLKGHLYVDHCHKTGAIRGLLCNNCNSAIGLLKEDEKLFAAAVTYLSRRN